MPASEAHTSCRVLGFRVRAWKGDGLAASKPSFKIVAKNYPRPSTILASPKQCASVRVETRERGSDLGDSLPALLGIRTALLVSVGWDVERRPNVYTVRMALR